LNRQDRRLALAVGSLALALLAMACGISALVWATLDAAEREAVASVLQPRAALVVMALTVVLALGTLSLRKLFESYVAAPAQLLEQVQVLMNSDMRREIEAHGSTDNRELAKAIAALLHERAQLRDEMARKVAEASQDIERERSRLAALMSELTQSVLVCNLDGRILLYNSRARLQFRALSNAPSQAGGTELIGLGRSIHAVFDRRLVDHALENVQLRLKRGAITPTTQFVTLVRSGQLLRVQMAPVLNPMDAQSGAGMLGGFVLMLENITVAFEQDSLRDRLLHHLTEASRASLANLKAAVEVLEFPDLEPATRARFHAVIRDEVAAMVERVQGVAVDTANQIKTRWPLEDMLASDLITAGQRHIEAAYGLQVGTAEIDPDLWLRVDSFSLLQALTYLAGRLQSEFGVKEVLLRLARAGPRAQLDLSWAGAPLSSETASAWQTDPMQNRTSRVSSPLTVGDVAERHGGEFWFERERSGDRSFFRFLLPVAESHDLQESAQPPPESRPEYYDFDLFQTSPQSRRLDDRNLGELIYTVFDTETTGLDPTGGDEIIQIGATRIVNGKLLKTESFLQLVDPQRMISPASSHVHGISRETVRGQPTISEVLPAFHAFASDTVLVAHNAAFDMRFLELKQHSTGVRFDQPVLDTLLLSAVVHANQASHSLEAIAQRLDLPVIERHTALGDALVTAEVFLRLIPLLNHRGILTLGQARAAARQTYYARLRY
jgi:DNA polymerase-3 subunit epsilon